MEMQKAGSFSSWWSELVDLQAEILARLPFEFVYKYRIVCKQWNDLLSSNYFLRKWSETPFNKNQPRLVILSGDPGMSSMAFCFYTRSWIKSFSLSFLKDSTLPDEFRESSVAGLILVHGVSDSIRSSLTLCNPYAKAFVVIPSILEVECIVEVENINQKSDTGYKIVAAGNYQPLDRQIVGIYEPSQNRWNIAGYFPEDLTLDTNSQLVFWNGSFYAHCRMAVNGWNGIVRFNIPLEGNSSAVQPLPIPMLFVPYPELVRDRNRREYFPVLSYPRMITCGSRLLLTAAKWMVEQAGGERGGELQIFEPVIIMWEFRNEEHHAVDLSNSPRWEWVEIARMPSFFCNEWMNKLLPEQKEDFLADCCIGVGDYVCFVPSFYRARSNEVVDVVAYNLIDNTWNWLPSCHMTDSSVELGCLTCDEDCDCRFHQAIAFLPSPHVKVTLEKPVEMLHE